MQCTLLRRYSLFGGFLAQKQRSLTSRAQASPHLGSTRLLVLCEMQRCLQHCLRLKLSPYLLSLSTSGNTPAPEGSFYLFSKGTAGIMADVFQGAPVLRVTQLTLVESPDVP